MLSLAEARSRILSEAEALEAIEVPLAEAVGLVLAEPAVGDVDLPPFDRAACDGYALRASDARAGARLRVVGSRSMRPDESPEVEADEATRLAAGDALPMGADAVLRTEDSRPDHGLGPPCFIEVLRAVERSQNVIRRGHFLRAGAELAPSRTRVSLARVGLLASQGGVHPVCHRRVRVAVMAVGDHLVGPSEAPVMQRERNAAGPAVVAACLRHGATAHDFGTIAEAELETALRRALTAPITVVLGPIGGALSRALIDCDVEIVVSGVALHPGKRLAYGVARGLSGRNEHHVFHLPHSPIAALTATALLIIPLIDRLQGGGTGLVSPLRAVWNGTHRATDDRLWAVPVTLGVDDQARLVATQLEHRGKEDLFGFSCAEALALLPPGDGPWRGGEIVAVEPLGPWPSG